MDEVVVVIGLAYKMMKCLIFKVEFENALDSVG